MYIYNRVESGSDDLDYSGHFSPRSQWSMGKTKSPESPGV